MHCDRADDDVMDTGLFFSRFPNFHRVESIAVNRCAGRVLDLGAGAGRHSLELQHRGLATLAVDSDALLCSLMQKRGVKNTLCTTWQELETDEKFDTVLVLMNGAGLCGRKTDFPAFAAKLKTLLAPRGKLLMDSSSVDYLPPPEPGIEPQEVRFHFSYQKEQDEPFFWYFAELPYLLEALPRAGLDAKCVYRHDDGRFLMEATLI